MAGDLPPGGQLPSIPALVTQYGAATATIQRALATLKDEGHLYSEVGKGVYVRSRTPLVVAAAAYLTPVEGTFAYDLLDVTEAVPPVEVGRALGLGAAEPAVVRQRLLRYQGEPVELSWPHYPPSIARDTALARRGRISGGAPRVLADLGHPQQDYVDRLSARMPTTEELELLELPADVPVLRQFRVISSAGRPIEVTIMIKGAHRHEVRYHHRIDPAGDR